ncbi:MAG: peptidoglycan-binding protein [Pseudomonadota bacterium]
MISAAQLKMLFPRASSAHIDTFAAAHVSLFARYGIDKNLFRRDFFLAQIGHESAGMSIERENLNYSAARLMVVWPRRFPTLDSAQSYAGNPQKLANFVYSGRNGNGTEASGDGFLFRGRGYMQLTGREGYREAGSRAALDLISSPDKVFATDHALNVALAFWKWKGANAVCDSGDFKAVTKIVNGGTIGMPERVAWLDKVRRVLAEPPPRKLQPNVALNILVQKALRARGYIGIGAADGVIGSRTTAAIADFRLKKGLGVGVLDDKLLTALGVVFP